MNSTIETINIDLIDPSPFRHTDKYPFVRRKIEALKSSINAVGLWEGVIARRNGNRIELAFGHHRVQAAKELQLTDINIILRDLSDEEMLSFMGRENMEDYNADFLVMLETWEATWDWKAKTSSDGSSTQPIDVAILLGWTQDRASTDGYPTSKQMNRTADACNSAYQLLRNKHVTRADLHDMTVNEAREILTRASAKIKQIETAGKALGTSPAHITAAKQAVAKAIRTTANQSRAGTVAQKDLRGKVDVNAYEHARSSPTKQTPLFRIFGKDLGDSIAKMLKTDIASEKLEGVVKSLGDITLEEDLAVVRRVDFELGELSIRAEKWQRKLKFNKVVPLKEVE